MGFLVVAEGIENPTERDCVISLGCDLRQGFLFAGPRPAVPHVKLGSVDKKYRSSSQIRPARLYWPPLGCGR